MRGSSVMQVHLSAGEVELWHEFDGKSRNGISKAARTLARNKGRKFVELLDTTGKPLVVLDVSGN